MYPIIENISDVLPAIEGRDEFIVMDKGDYIVIDYVYVDGQSFDDPIRRECRGLIFDKATGTLLRRPLEKFDNYGERFSQDNCDWGKEHIVTDKRDGSMIAPFINNHSVRLATRAGITEHSIRAEDLLTFSVADGCRHLIADNCTPIFEWTSPDNRIVLDYKESELRLLRIRNMKTGKYMEWEAVEFWAGYMGVKTVDRFHGLFVSPEWIERQRAVGVGVEGFVIFWPHNSFSVKVKTDEYTQMHRAVSYFERENMVLPIVLDQQYDDLLPALSEDRQKRVKEYAEEVWRQFMGWYSTVNSYCIGLAPMETRKEQALWIQANVRRELWPVLFGHLDGKPVKDTLKAAILKHPEILSVRWK